MSKDSLGNRMKDYEGRSRYFLPKRSYTLIRCDGKSFHNYTKGCDRPFDFGLISDMQQTTKYLCEQMNAEIGYCQSDEISIVLTDFKTITTEALFDGNLQKLCSISSSIVTSKFNQLRMIRANSFDVKIAQFDSRVWTVSDPWEVFNTFLWRQQDATRNSVQMVAQSLCSHKELQGKNINQQQEMIFQKGQNWNDYPTFCRRGTIFYKSENGYVTDLDCPILSQDQKYFFDKIPLIPQPSF